MFLLGVRGTHAPLLHRWVSESQHAAVPHLFASEHWAMNTGAFDALHTTAEPLTALSTGGETTTMMMLTSAPIIAAAAQMFAFDLVSAPIICPMAYTATAKNTMSMAIRGRVLCRLEHKSSMLLVTLEIPLAEKA